MARISGVDLPREKRVEIGLTYIYGIGLSTSQKILKEAGIVSMYREGTKNYYYVNAYETIWKKIGNLFTKINEIVDEISEKECSKSQIEIESNTKSSDVVTLGIKDKYTEGELLTRMKNNGYSCK